MQSLGCLVPDESAIGATTATQLGRTFPVYQGVGVQIAEKGWRDFFLMRGVSVPKGSLVKYRKTYISLSEKPGRMLPSLAFSWGIGGVE